MKQKTARFHTQSCWTGKVLLNSAACSQTCSFLACWWLFSVKKLLAIWCICRVWIQCLMSVVPLVWTRSQANHYVSIFLISIWFSQWIIKTYNRKLLSRTAYKRTLDIRVAHSTTWSRRFKFKVRSSFISLYWRDREKKKSRTKLPDTIRKTVGEWPVSLLVDLVQERLPFLGTTERLFCVFGVPNVSS